MCMLLFLESHPHFTESHCYPLFSEKERVLREAKVSGAVHLLCDIEASLTEMQNLAFTQTSSSVLDDKFGNLNTLYTLVPL